ncbi:MAG TPA: hypothetical protein VFD02_02555 [Syntrophomonadaceae bacterium]|nr:hypothetical protein [Syntrophomonadaceae bacterium]
MFPVVFLIIALFIYKPGIKYTYYHIFYGLLSLNITSSLLAWVLIPFISLFTLPPAGDDTTKFLDITGLHPLIVSFTALLIIATLVFFTYKRGLIGKIKEIKSELFQASSRKNNKAFLIPLFIGVLLGVIIVAVGFSVLRPKPVLETYFSMEVNPTTENMEFPFKVDKSKSYNMNLELETKNILTDVQIYSENKTLVYQNIAEWFSLGTSFQLEKGNYVFVLTFLKKPKDMQEHFNTMGYMFEDDTIQGFKEIYSKNNGVKDYRFSCSVNIK